MQEVSTHRHQEVQEHLDALNKAHKDHKAALQMPCTTPGELITRSNALGDASERYRLERSWLWSHGFSLHDYFRYDYATDSYIWPD